MNKLIVSSSPHINKPESVSKIMWVVVASLMPAGIASAFIFGPKVFTVIALGIVSAVIAEAVIQFMTRRKITIYDGSAVLTGLLLAYNLPCHVPFWIPIIGSFFAIAIGKQVFGGLGQNIFNPALIGRAFLMASWPKYMTTFTSPFLYDAVTSATPLAMLKEGKDVIISVSYKDLFMGFRGGCIGEVCIIALLLGASYLLLKGYISWHIPFTYIGITALFTWAFGGKSLFGGDWLFHVLNGGLILGAFFMATDYVTCPLTRKGRILFAVGCGLLTGIIRIWGGYPEGVCYSILIMNAATPIIDRYTRPRIYGTGGKSAVGGELSIS